DPQKNAVRIADRIHDSLKPGPAFIAGKAANGTLISQTTVIPFRSDDNSLEVIRSCFILEKGKMDDVLRHDGAMISSKLASLLNAGIGNELKVSYAPQFENEDVSFKIKVKGIYKNTPDTGDLSIYMNEAGFYPKYYDHLPAYKNRAGAFIPSVKTPFKAILGNEWELLDRTRNTDEMRKKW